MHPSAEWRNGRRDGFKIHCPQGRVGSTPTSASQLCEWAIRFVVNCRKYRLRKLSKVVPGGATRAESVWCGLQAVRSATAEIIAVHDGVRPFVTPEEIARTVGSAQVCEAAILVAPAADTIKEVENCQVVRTLKRAAVRRALTPQCFRYSLLRRAYEQADLNDPELTDESVLVERLGVQVAVVEGSSRNIKITRPEDLAIGELLLRHGL